MWNINWFDNSSDKQFYYNFIDNLILFYCSFFLTTFWVNKLFIITIIWFQVIAVFLWLDS